MNSLRGIWAAALTPVTPEYEPDARRAIPYYRELLENGCDGLNLLGTTGEAMSFSSGQRLRFMETIAASGLPMDRLMVGTGAASLDDAASLMRAAFEYGFAAALVMPPFFFRDASDDGIVTFFDALLARAHAPGKRVLLYNFPRMSGITFHPELTDRLANAFPHAIVGMKDSSNDRQLQAEVLRRRGRDFIVFPGAEDYLLEAKAYGAAGCISGSVCLWPSLANSVLQSGDAERAAQLAQKRQALTGAPLITVVRKLVAESRDDAEWKRSMPPLTV